MRVFRSMRFKILLQLVVVVAVGIVAFESGIGLVRQAGETFETITAEVRRTTDRIEDISASTEQIAAGSEQVTASVSELAARSNHFAQSVAAANGPNGRSDMQPSQLLTSYLCMR